MLWTLTLRDYAEMIDAYNWMHAPLAAPPRERTAQETATWFARAWEACRNKSSEF